LEAKEMKIRQSLIFMLIVLSLVLAACGGAATTEPQPTTAADTGSSTQPTAAVETGNNAEPTAAPAAEKTKVTVWIPGDEGRWFIENELDKAFEAANPQYTLEVVQLGWDTIHDKMITAFAGGQAPDAALVADDYIGEFSGLGGLREVSDFVNKYGLQDAFLPGAYEYFRQADGGVYAVPALMEVRVLFYRTDLFEAAGITEPPTTLDELVADGLKLTNGTTQFGLADQTSWLDQHFFTYLLYTMGGDVYTADHKTCILNNEKGIEALTFYKSLYDQNIIPKDPNQRVETFTGFKQGYYAMAESGPWWFGLLQEQAPEIEGKWNVAFLPAGETTTAYGHPQPMILPANSANPDGGEAFVAWFLTPEVEAKWHSISRQVPALAAAYDLPEMQNDAYLMLQRDAILRGQNSLKDIPHATDTEALIYTMTEEVKNGLKTPEQAANDACARMDPLLNQ
jgi:multiple sugar transport system substrate-binding protein